MTFLEMLVRTSLLTLLVLSFIILIGGTVFVVHVALMEYFDINMFEEIRGLYEWIIKRLKTK